MCMHGWMDIGRSACMYMCRYVDVTDLYHTAAA